MSYTQLKDEIKKAASKAFSELQNQHPNEKFFAFVLSTMDDHNYINASANSLESYQRITERNDTDEVYNKWIPSEWEHEYIGQHHFKCVDNLLEKLVNEIRNRRI